MDNEAVAAQLKEWGRVREWKWEWGTRGREEGEGGREKGLQNREGEKGTRILYTGLNIIDG